MNDQTFEQCDLKFGLRAFERQPAHAAGIAMKALDSSAALRMLARGFLALGYFAALGFLALLTFIWVLGGQFFQLADRFAHGPKMKMAAKIRE